MSVRSLVPRHLDNLFATALRVARRRNPIGRFQLVLHALSLLTFPLDLLLSVVQRLAFLQDVEPKHPVIFISGYSRSGTTLIYQVLAGVWEVEYLNNLLVLFPRSYLLVNYLFRKFDHRRPTSFRNFFGTTWGLSGTNDGPQLFYSWLSEEGYVQGRPMSSRAARAMNRFFGTYQARFQRSVLTKNCNNYLIFDQLARHVANSYFIFVRRDPVRIVASTLKAREFVQGDARHRWEFTLKGVRHGEQEDPILEIALNVRSCYQRIAELRRVLPPDRLMIVGYEDFCRDPVSIVQELSRRIFGRIPERRHLESKLGTFKISPGPPLHPEEERRIREVVSQVMPRPIL